MSEARHRSRVALVALVLLAGLSFAACGKGGGGADGPVTLHVAIWKPSNPEAWDEAVAGFEAAHPDIRIDRAVFPNSSTQFHDILAQRLRNRDESLDVFLMDVVWPAEFARAGWALSLDDRFTEEEQAAFLAPALDACRVDGQVYGVPFDVGAGLLYYRKDVLDRAGLAPPATWTELAGQARRIRDTDPDAPSHGYSAQLAQYEGLVCNVLELVASANGRIEAPATPEVTSALAFLRDEVVGGLAPRGILTWQEQESLDFFRSGGAVFHRNWPYAWPLLNAPDSPVAGKVGVALLPGFGGGGPTPALGGWSFGIHSRTRHADAAWNFVRYMTGPEVQKAFARNGGRAPARHALYDDPDVLAANPQFEALGRSLETAAVRPRTPAYAGVSLVLQRCFHRAIGDPDADVLALTSDAATALDRLVVAP